MFGLTVETLQQVEVAIVFLVASGVAWLIRAAYVIDRNVQAHGFRIESIETKVETNSKRLNDHSGKIENIDRAVAVFHAVREEVVEKLDHFEGILRGNINHGGDE